VDLGRALDRGAVAAALEHDLADRPAPGGVAVQQGPGLADLRLGGYTSMPGQPGTAPSLPRVPKSNIDSSEITWSWSPRSHSTGGLSGRSAKALVSHHLPEKALLTRSGRAPPRASSARWSDRLGRRCRRQR
jgi:hypothetical protein